MGMMNKNPSDLRVIGSGLAGSMLPFIILALIYPGFRRQLVGAVPIFIIGILILIATRQQTDDPSNKG